MMPSDARSSSGCPPYPASGEAAKTAVAETETTSQTTPASPQIPEQTPVQTPGPTPVQTPEQTPVQQQPPAPEPSTKPEPTGPVQQPTTPTAEAPKPCPPAPQVATPGTPPPTKPAPLPTSCELPKGSTPQQQLDDLKRLRDENQTQLEAADKIKASMTDLTQRIAALEKLVDGLTTDGKGYAAFYNATEVIKHKTDCAVATIEKHLEDPKILSPEQRQCTNRVIKDEKRKVDEARAALDTRRAEVASLTAEHEKAAQNLTAAKEVYGFLRSGMLDEVKKKLADLTKLNQGADPPKDPCVAHFFLQEMKDLLSSAYSDQSQAAKCYQPSSLNIGTFLACWTPVCYQTRYAEAVVAFNNAEYLEKCLKIELDALKKKLADAEKAAAESADKRRDRILAALEKECCKKPVPAM